MFSELGGGIAGRERTQKMRFLQAQIPRERRALHEGEYSGPSAVETGKDRAEEGPHGQFTPLSSPTHSFHRQVSKPWTWKHSNASPEGVL